MTVVVDYLTVRLARLLFGLALASVLSAPACLAQTTSAAQPDPEMVDRLVGRVISKGQPEWNALHKLVLASYPDCKRFASSGGSYYVWRVRSEDLVFQATSPPSTDAAGSAGFYWFDLHSAPLFGTAFPTGDRLYFRTCAMVGEPGVSAYVVEAKLSGPLGKVIQEDFAFDGYNPALIRYANADGGLIQNPYDSPDFTCGPKPPVYSNFDMLAALEGANPLQRLQALTWLAGRHSPLSADIVDIFHEPVADSIRFWSISNDSTIAQAASSLGTSEAGWVSEAAKFYVSISKPQPVPSITLEPRLKTLSFNDLRIGHGGDFDDRRREVKMGDRVVVEYEFSLSTGAVAFTNLNATVSPPVFRVGSNQVISGLSQGMIGMKAGGLRVIDVPASLAYGAAGADVVPPGADLTIKVWLLHIATEPPFGMESEKILNMRDLVIGSGDVATSDATVNLSCAVYRMDGHPLDVPEISALHQLVLATGSPLRKALIGMRAGGVRRLLVNMPAVFHADREWFHYGAKVLEVKLESISK